MLSILFASLATFCALQWLGNQGIRCISNLPYGVSFLIFTGCAIAMLILAMRRWPVMAVRVICTVLSLALGFIGILGLALSASFPSTSNDVYSTSPSGAHTVLSSESSFISLGRSYSAYPMLNRFFYRELDNGYVSVHDGGGTIRVEWPSDVEAIVHIDDPASFLDDGSNEDCMISVWFD